MRRLLRALLQRRVRPISSRTFGHAMQVMLWTCFASAVSISSTYAAGSKMEVSVLRMWKVTQARIPTGALSLSINEGKLAPITDTKTAARGNILLNLMLYLQPLRAPISVVAQDIGLQAGRKTWSALLLHHCNPQMAFMPMFAKTVDIPQPGAAIVVATIEIPEGLVPSSILVVKGQNIKILKSAISQDERMRQFAEKLQTIYKIEGEPVEFGPGGKLTSAPSSTSQTSPAEDSTR